jgi:hypothetical protein
MSIVSAYQQRNLAAADPSIREIHTVCKKLRDIQLLAEATIKQAEAFGQQLPSKTSSTQPLTDLAVANGMLGNSVLLSQYQIASIELLMKQEALMDKYTAELRNKHTLFQEKYPNICLETVLWIYERSLPMLRATDAKTEH